VSCDNTGDCNVCADCTFQGTCAQTYDDCINESDCIAFSDCLDQTCNGDPNCMDLCAQQHPVGAPLYWALIDCVVCEQCPNDCGASPDWCAQAAL